MSLKEMTDHIYGRANMITRQDRPNLFIKELDIYIDYLKNKLEEAKASFNKKEEKYLVNFTNNMKEGVLYYQNLFKSVKGVFEDIKISALKELEKSELTLNEIHVEIKKLSAVAA